MLIREHEQKRAIARVHDLMKSYDNAELILGELASLGFLPVSDSTEPYALEQNDLELHMRLRLNPDMSVAGYELMTFDELREETAAD